MFRWIVKISVGIIELATESSHFP